MIKVRQIEIEGESFFQRRKREGIIKDVHFQLKYENERLASLYFLENCN